MISSNRVSSNLSLESCEFAQNRSNESETSSSVINSKENVQNSIKKKNGAKVRLTCEVCGKKFFSISTYQKHVKCYPNKHKLYKCCNKVEESVKAHQCKKKISVTKEAVDVEISVRSENNEFDMETDVDPENHSEENNCSNDENGEFDDFKVFGKSKRTSTKKPKTDKPEYEKNKIFKCQECSQTFERYHSLSQHNKTVHKKQGGKLRCPICDEEFNTDEDYKSHFLLHGPEDKVVCKGCKKLFNSLKSYYVHAKQNPGVHCFLCKLCLRKFRTELMLEQHVCICQNGKPLHCACGEEFTKYKDVIAHSKGTKPFYCCSCPHHSTSLTAYIRHLRKHSKQKPFQCSKCDMKFAVIEFLNFHMKKQHTDNSNDSSKDQISSLPERHLCTICGEEFKSDDELKKHGLQHERVQCPDCGKLLKQNRLENHRSTHKRSASLCPECGKLFDTRLKLTQHIITTHNKEPAKCDICLKVLKTKKILNEHMKTHLKSEVGGRVPQAICPICGLGLAQKGSLARHILLTHERHKIVPCDKPYTCQECSAVLPNRGKYYSHRRMHRAMVDRFPCEICGREFNKKENLRRHIYLLHDEKRVISDPIFKCQICTRCFREKKNLKRHYKMVHKLEDIA